MRKCEETYILKHRWWKCASVHLWRVLWQYALESLRMYDYFDAVILFLGPFPKKINGQAESETESEVMKRKPQKKKKKEREREWETDKAIISVSFSTLYPRPGHGASTCADWGAKKASKNSSPWLLLYHRWGIWRGEVRWGRKGWHFPRRSIREGKTPLTAASKVVFWGFFNNKRLNFSVSLYHQRH